MKTKSKFVISAGIIIAVIISTHAGIVESLYSI